MSVGKRLRAGTARVGRSRPKASPEPRSGRVEGGASGKESRAIRTADDTLDYTDDAVTDELELYEVLQGAAHEAARIKEDARAEAAEIIRTAREAAAYRIDRLGRSRRSPASRLALVAVVAFAAALATAGGWELWGRGAPVAPVSARSQPAAGTSLCPIPARYRDAFVAASQRERVPIGLLAAVASVESSWQPGEVSRRGAIGLLQLLPSTAAYLHVNPHDWRQNVLGGARFLHLMLARYHGNTELALAAYNAGPYRVAQHNVPLETVVYVGAVMAQQAATSGCR